MALRKFLANGGKPIVATSSNQVTLLNRFLPCLNRTCLLIASVPLQDSAPSLHWRIQGKQASRPPDENRTQRTAKSRLPLRASLASALFLPQPESDRDRDRMKSLGPRLSCPRSQRVPPPLALVRSLAPSLRSSLALRRTSQLVAGGRLRREHVTLESSWKEGRRSLTFLTQNGSTTDDWGNGERLLRGPFLSGERRSPLYTLPTK